VNVSAALASGRGLRRLTIVDSYTRECPAIEVASSIGSRQVTRTLERIIAERGKPQSLRLWRKHHLNYDQTKHVVEQTRRKLGLEAPRERRRTVERLDRAEIERLIKTAYGYSSRYGFLVKMLFYTGARVSEFVRIRVEDLHLALDPPQVYIANAKGGSDGYVPILPALAQELRTHLDGRRNGYVFESNRSDKYTPRAAAGKEIARQAAIDKNVTPHRLRASVVTILLDAGMPLDQVQKFLRHKRITTTQIYAETSLHGMGENYVRARRQTVARALPKFRPSLG
jgi:integrase/recombinase XerD